MAETSVADRHIRGAARAHQFDDAVQQSDASTMGMWVFLVTEIMFFGGLFASYTIYRGMHPGVFAAVVMSAAALAALVAWWTR